MENLNTNLSKEFNRNTPVIFNKKLNKSNLKKLDYIYTDSGKIKHYTPAAQEWYNSIYAYNHNYIKGLPTLDKSLMALLKGYFSMFISHKILKTKYISKVSRRRSAKKIFIGKGELKHTSNKVIITFYVYNTERLSLKRTFIKLYKSLYSPKKKYIRINNNRKILTYLNKPLIKYMTLDNKGNMIKDIDGNEIISYNRPYTIEEFLDSPKNISTKVIKGHIKSSAVKTKETKETEEAKQITFYDAYSFIVESFINETSIYLKALIKYYGFITNLVEKKILNNNDKYLIYTKFANYFYNYNYPNYDYYKSIADKSYKKNLYRLQYLLKINSVKFEKPFIVKLTHLVEKLYNKKVEFNIVNINKVHLNSDILTQAIVLKAKSKRKNIYNVIKSSLNKVRLSNLSRLSDRVNKFNKDEYLINKIRNTYINNMLERNIKIDSLNELLLDYFPWADKLESKDPLKDSISLKDHIFKDLKHFKLAGVRVEAKGRLSKRFVASRSVFKVYWKGGLRNVDSSFKGLSAVMLRGDAKSNVEYSMLKSKVRTGAFGIKGWVSSK